MMFIPGGSRAAANRDNFNNEIVRECLQVSCRGDLLLHVRFDTGITLTQPCSFWVDEHILAHFKGQQLQYFSSPTCKGLPSKRTRHLNSVTLMSRLEPNRACLPVHGYKMCVRTVR
jgi:hypothetical protein